MASEYPSEFSTVVGDFGGGSSAASQPRLDIMRMFRLRWPVMLAVFLVCAIPAAILAWILVPAQYTAVATLRFLSVQPQVITDSRILTEPWDKYVNTQVNMLMDNDVLGRALNEPKVRGLPVVQAQDAPLEFLKAKVSARLQPGTELVRVMCTLPERDATKTIVDTVVAVYLDMARKAESELGGNRMGTLLRTEQQLTSELDMLSTRIYERQRELGVPLLPFLPNPTQSETQMFQEAINDADRELMAARSRSDAAKRALDLAEVETAKYAQDPSGPIYSFGIEQAVAMDPRVVSLRSGVTALQSELVIKGQNATERNPQLQADRKRLTTLEGRLAQVERDARGDALKSFKFSKEHEFRDAEEVAARAQQLRDDYMARLDEHRKDMRLATETFTDYDELRRKRDEKQKQLDIVTAEINTIRIESSAPGRVQSASQAVVPPNPQHGKRFQYMLLGIMASAGLSVTFGLWRELMDQQVRSPQDIQSVTAIPIVATIPHVSEDRLPDKTHSPLLIMDHPNSPTADEFRRILVRLLYPVGGAAEINSCLVTSPTRGDGKTSMACNLATALAEADRRVLLLDISFREASVEKCFGLEEAPGLCDILCGSGTLLEYIRPTPVPNLHLLGPGFGDGDLAGRLASRELLELLEEAEHEFDHVIIDSPPSLLMADARLLAPVVDGVIVVVGAGVSTLGMIRRCLRELDQAGATVIGIALNKLRGTRGGYLRSNLDLYYNYSTDRTKEWDLNEVPEMEIIDADGAPVGADVALLDHDDVADLDETEKASRF
jgi:polysaccharide biosynthesis transport protein